MKTNLSGWDDERLFVQGGSTAPIFKNMTQDRKFKTSYHDWSNKANRAKPITFPTIVCGYMSKIHFWPESLEDRWLQDDNADEWQGIWFQVRDSWGHAIQHGFTSFDRVHARHTWWDIKTMVVNPSGDATNYTIYITVLPSSAIICVSFLSMYFLIYHFTILYNNKKKQISALH